MRTSVTLAQSKVKLKVTELLKLWKSQFSMSISSAIFSWSWNWWLVVIARDLIYSPFWAWFWNFLKESYHGSSYFEERRYLAKFKWPYFRTAWGCSHMVRHAGSPTVLCMLIWPWPDPRSRSLTFYSFENLCAGRSYNLVIVIAGRPQQAVHAGGDDRQPLCGLFYYVSTQWLRFWLYILKFCL